MSSNLDLELKGGVARVTMHRGSNNAIADDLLTDLAAAFDQLGGDRGCRVVILQSGLPRYFSVGADLAALGAIDREAADAEDRLTERILASARLFSRLEACPKPVIAAIAGHALGGGLELALCCDYRIMVDDGQARIGQTEAALGLMPGAGGTQRLVRLIGRARALPLLLEARRLSAIQALELGLVDLAPPPEALAAALDELAGRLAESATLALGLIKDAVNRGYGISLDEGLKIEARNFARSALSRDAMIGVMSFLAKQRPEFEGE